MADTPDITSCAEVSAASNNLYSPFYALNYHFGMLLGVDDFATGQLHHEGKMRLHNAWLHRAGVVWGFDVRLDVPHGEIRVLPGLALDGAGHELHLEGDACVNVAEWLAAHKDDAGFIVSTSEAGVVTFDAHVEIRFRSCLTRQVPSLVEPCNGSQTGTSYSRIFETVDIRLLPGLAPAPAPAPYHRLRVLFGLEAAVLPADQLADDARTAVLALAAADQPAAYLVEFRKLAALDEIDLKPATTAGDEARTLFPDLEYAPVVLANVTAITLGPAGTSGALTLTDGGVDVTVRPSHVATATIQELLCGPLFSAGPSTGGTPDTATTRVASNRGPRVLRESVKVTASSIDFDLTAELDHRSAVASAFPVTSYTAAKGWVDCPVSVTLSSGPPHVTLHLKNHIATGDLVRLIARGTGSRPLLGTSLVPLAGAAGGPQPPAGDGIDFVFMQVRS